ncbi:hypothetical protein ACP4OV_028953 [Aristida adscensionis]
MADCRSLIEFLRAFEHHRHRRAASSDPATASSSPRSRRGSAPASPSSSRSRPRRLFTSLCDRAPLAAADALVLLAALAALACLAAPYARLAAAEVREAVALHPAASCVPLAAGAAAAAAVLAWEAASHRARRCGRPRCRGLRKAVEFDIQLETEECVRRLPPPPPPPCPDTRPVELGVEHLELEVELRKMAPPNGRTVLIFRAPCGCPKGRMEVWGAKKVRRIKK